MNTSGNGNTEMLPSKHFIKLHFLGGDRVNEEKGFKPLACKAHYDKYGNRIGDAFYNPEFDNLLSQMISYNGIIPLYKRSDLVKRFDDYIGGVSVTLAYMYKGYIQRISETPELPVSLPNTRTELGDELLESFPKRLHYSQEIREEELNRFRTKLDEARKYVGFEGSFHCPHVTTVYDKALHWYVASCVVVLKEMEELADLVWHRKTNINPVPANELACCNREYWHALPL